MKEVTYDVPNVSCDHCVATVSKVAKEQGVNDVQVDLVSKKVYVAFDPASVNEGALIEALSEEGYDVTNEMSGKHIGGDLSGKKTLNVM